jgi:nitrogen fixation/metabolism regulation signal transduction histidine kinase
VRRTLPTRAGRLLAGLVIGIGAVLLYLLSSASSNTPMFAEGLPWLLLAGLVVVLALLTVVGYQLLRLRRRVKQRVFGSKLSVRLVLVLALIAVLPGALVYAVSVQFLSRSIDTWFNVHVDRALEGGLLLGRNTLDTMLQDLKVKADAMALTLSDGSPRSHLRVLNALREQAGVQQAAVIDANGQAVVFSGDETIGVVPDPLSPAVLRDLRLQKAYRALVYDAAGELMLRVVVPIGVPESTAVGLEVLQHVPASVSQSVEAVRQAYDEYEELSLSRVGLKRLYGLALTLSLLLALFSALLLGILFSERLAAPLGVLAEGTRAVAQGDFSQRNPVRSYDEIGILTHSFNAMTRDLATAQRETQEYQQQLESAKASLESILANLSAGVISLDGRYRLSSANPSAGRILGADLAALGKLPVADWADVDPRLRAIAGPLEEALATGAVRDWQRQVAFPGPQGELTLLMRASAIGAGADGGFVVVFDDITRLLQAQRQAAWGEVARRLAHEIKNPLTPIQLSAERLQVRLHGKLEAADEEMLGRLTRTIVNQVAALKGMVDAFSQYARSPDTELRPLDLAVLLREVLGLYESTGSRIQFRAEPGLPRVAGDAAKLRQVLHNLLQNAEDAVSGVSMPRIEVSLAGDDAGVALRVADNGIGFPADIMARVFEPYVTTKAKGTGLGLAIVHKIVEEHGGSIRVENRQPAGALVTIVLPALAVGTDMILAAAPAGAAHG